MKQASALHVHCTRHPAIFLENPCRCGDGLPRQCLKKNTPHCMILQNLGSSITKNSAFKKLRSLDQEQNPFFFSSPDLHRGVLTLASQAPYQANIIAIGIAFTPFLDPGTLGLGITPKWLIWRSSAFSGHRRFVGWIGSRIAYLSTHCLACTPHQK